MPSAPFDVDIQVEDVGGPSAGLMLTLGIVELADERDLTGGDVVAGTGTIDEQGGVGPIGGITLKVLAAEDIGADLFLVPTANCAELLAAGDPPVPTASVQTLDDALNALDDLRAGRTPAPCR
jgi:PDZ domain-containing protein